MGKGKFKISSSTIKHWRKKLGLSQQDLAQILNVGVATISRWENDGCEPTGTAGAILATLTSDKNRTELVVSAAIGGAETLYRLLKDHFEGSEKHKPKRRRPRKRG
jgi:transcriptional regulator with XRE-family HTH domain